MLEIMSLLRPGKNIYLTLMVLFHTQICTLLRVLLELTLFNTSKYMNQF